MPKQLALGALKKLTKWVLFLTVCLLLLATLSIMHKLTSDLAAVTDKALKDIEAIAQTSKPAETGATAQTEVSSKP
ncbi:MAG: hypothetical protein EON60_07465 [Alphaproteobacteria bacterium]|nr:MAG: hypothetical protein EON60_07465 [Alphaproteobacteria bacterium]